MANENFSIYYATGKNLYKRWGIKNDWVNIGIIALIKNRLDNLQTEDPELYSKIILNKDLDESSRMLADNIFDRFKQVGHPL